MSQGSLFPPTWIGDGETCNKRRLCFLACVTTFHFHNSPIGRAEWPHQIEESDLDLEGLDDFVQSHLASWRPTEDDPRSA